MPIPITQVRYSPEEGEQVLRRFIFGGPYAGRRPPRGVPPPTVVEFIVENVKPDAKPHVFLRTVDTALFYESKEILPHIRQMLTARETDSRSVQRSAYCLQLFGNLGTPEEVVQAAQYFDRILVPHQAAGENLDLLLATLPTLAPAGNIDRIYQRIGEQIREATEVPKPDDPENMRALGLQNIMSLKVPVAATLLQGKSRLLAQTPAQRRMELISIYLGQSPLSDEPTHIWAGRLLRKECMELDPAPVYADLGRAIDAADPQRLDPERAEFITHRAAQAIIYLQGKLTKGQQARYAKVKEAPQNFLWDDPFTGETRDDAGLEEEAE